MSGRGSAFEAGLLASFAGLLAWDDALDGKTAFVVMWVAVAVLWLLNCGIRLAKGGAA